MECWPESPEGVALVLLALILGETEAHDVDHVIGLYRRCLAAVHGDDSGGCFMHHEPRH